MTMVATPDIPTNGQPVVPTNGRAAKAPPHDPDAERAILGACLLAADDGAIVDAARRTLHRDNPFYDTRHARIWDAINTTVAAGDVPDPLTVGERVPGDRLYLAELYSAAPLHLDAARTARHAAIVNRHAAARTATTNLIRIEHLLGEYQADPDDRRMTRILTELQANVTALGDAVTGPANGAVDDPRTWAPMDVTAVLAGTYEPERPALMPRTDGAFLLYAGRVHSFHGESESGKSLAIQAVVANLLAAGGRAAYVDYESDMPAVVGRLVELGVPADAIRDRFDYIHPDASPHTTHEHPAWQALLGTTYDIVVIDGVTDALGISNVESGDNDAVARWMRTVPKPIAQNTGGAVVLIDHVTKDNEGRGRFAIGAQFKMAGVDGAAYTVEVTEALGRGIRGEIVIRVAKDRPGGIRPHCGPFRKLDRTQEAARIVVDSRKGGHITVEFSPPSTGANPTQPEVFRPTVLMERVSTTLLTNRSMSKNALRQAVKGKAAHIDTAIERLVIEGHARESKGARGAIIIEHLSHYTEAADKWQPGQDNGPRPDLVPPRPHLVPDDVPATSSPSHPPYGDGTRSAPTPGPRENPTSSRDDVGPPCGDCGWPLDSEGHAQNCGAEQ